MTCACDVVLELPSRAFDFSGTQGGETQTVVLTRATCVDELRELVVVVRVHAVTAGSGTLRVVAVPVAPTPEQPEVDYPDENTTLASLDVHAAAAGSLLRAFVQAPLPTHVQLRLVATMPSSPASFTSTLSLSLEGKR